MEKWLKEENPLWFSRERRQNNKGSSLVLVVAVMAIVGVFAVTLLSISYMNFQMKIVNKHSQENFYDAETILDQIRSGLVVDVGEAASIAYEKTLEKYSELDTEARNTLYKSTFTSKLLEKLEATDLGGHYTYSLSHLTGKVDPAALTGGGVLASADAQYALNVNATEGVFTIKNLKVSYKDSKDYLTEIVTDIELHCPKIDYSKSTQIPDLLNYCFVADDKVYNAQPALGVSISGNAYMGQNGGSFDNFSVSFAPQIGMENATIYCGGALQVNNGSSVSIGNKVDFWTRELCVDSSTFTTSGSKLYLEDDLILTNTSNTSATATLSGDVYAYGNPEYANSAAVYINEWDYADALQKNPADYSSAFIINGKKTTLNMAGVTGLRIAGNAYVGASLKNPSFAEDEDKNTDILMGESIALKSDQKAYLVPADCFANYCTNGGVNPMTAEAYNELRAEIRDRLGYASVNNVTNKDFVRVSETDASMEQKLVDWGVVDIRREVYRIAKSDGNDINMVYFFMVFKDAKSAAAFSKTYYEEEEHLSSLRERMSELGYDADVTEPHPLNFYYNGSVLFNQTNTKVIPGMCLNLSKEERSELRISQNKLQDHYAALGHKLLTDYSLLTYGERNCSAYKNLVKSMDGVVGTTVFEDKTDANAAAVVVNGSYVLDKNTTADGTPIYLVIADGDVTVKTSFTGLILAKGELILDPPAGEAFLLQADSSKVALALGVVGSEGLRPADYLIDGDRYLVGGAPGAGGAVSISNGAIDFTDCVTYKNWNKQ